ncbi:MAG: secondary thiamine-phosphate synthase enzyme YjbQ [Lewinella sp.]|jgi:secondary thiamine-phosphate synthase enzyme|uniref:secondary thiamine-phosphate synthase enzyme YjbQ n=1 Tax=Lewinella sp. TaxID=2004506 RepID=UPI003D6B9A2D
MIQQVEFSLPAYPRGYHLITSNILRELSDLPEVGLLSIFIKHTSAALTVNENADPSVRTDFESIVNHIVPENLPFLKHTMEGPDDMPAHIKASFIGSSVTIPIRNGQLNLGTWQGVYLCEFRNQGGRRKLVATVYS